MTVNVGMILDSKNIFLKRFLLIRLGAGGNADPLTGGSSYTTAGLSTAAASAGTAADPFTGRSESFVFEQLLILSQANITLDLGRFILIS